MRISAGQPKGGHSVFCGHGCWPLRASPTRPAIVVLLIPGIGQSMCSENWLHGKMVDSRPSCRFTLCRLASGPSGCRQSGRRGQTRQRSQMFVHRTLACLMPCDAHSVPQPHYAAGAAAPSSWEDSRTHARTRSRLAWRAAQVTRLAWRAAATQVTRLAWRAAATAYSRAARFGGGPQVSRSRSCSRARGSAATHRGLSRSHAPSAATQGRAPQEV